MALDPTFYTAREIHEDAVGERAYARAKALRPEWQKIKDAAAIIKEACAELIAEQANGAIFHEGAKWQQIGTDADGGPIMGYRPGVLATDVYEIAAAVKGLETIDVAATCNKQADTWATEELEGE